jgi:hypothetical protein
MLAIVGVVVILLSVVGGYLLEGGSFMVLMQFVEFIGRGPLPGPLIFSSMRLYCIPGTVKPWRTPPSTTISAPVV